MTLDILVCDDDADTVTFLTHWLMKSGHGVRAVRSGYEALAALGERRYDMVVSDYFMANGTGGMLAHHCSEQHIPCMIVTGAEPEDVRPYVPADVRIVSKLHFRELVAMMARADALAAGGA